MTTRSTCARSILLWVALAPSACPADSADNGAGSSSGEASTTASTSDTTTSDTPTSDITTMTDGETGSSGEASSGPSSSSSADDTSGSSGGSSSDTGVGDCRPIIVEVFYDAEGGDDELQWVKLYNPCDAPIDLRGYSIGYGGEDYEPDIDPPFGVKQLANPDPQDPEAPWPAGGCYLAGGPTQDALNGEPELQLVEDFAPGLDLAEGPGAGVALFDFVATEVDATTVPIDAVVYGNNNDNGLIDATGAPVPSPHVGNSIAGGSIQRTSLDATWQTTGTPTPNACPPF